MPSARQLVESGVTYHARMSTRSPAPRLPLLPPRSALLLGVGGFLIELLLITPWVDDAADDNATVHFTQHGLIFIGGLVMGWALRDLRLNARVHERG
jgi:hypothetical protein